MEKYFVYLTDEELDTILDFTSWSKLDEVVDVWYDNDKGLCYFKDWDNDVIVPFEQALVEDLYPNIGTEGLVFADSPQSHRKIIENIFDKFCTDRDIVEDIKNINKTIDKAQGL